MKLHIHHTHKITADTDLATYSVLGQLTLDLASLRVTLHVLFKGNPKKYRVKLDLYDTEKVLSWVSDLSEKAEVDHSRLELEIFQLIDLLEAHREEQFNELFNSKPKKIKTLTATEENEAIAFLKRPHLLKQLNEKLAHTGIIGEEQNRLLLFIIATTYKMEHTLHGIIQSSSGSGKSHLINTIASLVPKEDVLSFSRVTSKAFYYYKSEDLTNKLILIQDLDGLNDEALYGLRELQSSGELTSSITMKDKLGRTQAKLNVVEGKFASLSATTKQVYLDNYSRSIILQVDESLEQTKRITDYQNRLLSGKIDKKAQQKAINLLTNCIRMLKPYEVFNKYLDTVNLPIESCMLRRLNFQFQVFVNQLVIIHQFQRKTDKQGRLIATKEDVKLAIHLFFDSIYMKVDELDAGLRNFFEELKNHTDKKHIEHPFTQREVRHYFNLNKTKVKRYVKELVELEYLQIVSGTTARGYHYGIQYVDDFLKQKETLKSQLLSSL